MIDSVHKLSRSFLFRCSSGALQTAQAQCSVCASPRRQEAENGLRVRQLCI